MGMGDTKTPTTHTAGPWKSIGEIYVNYQGQSTVIVVDKPGARHYIAAFPWIMPRDERRKAAVEADIRLIAAAPELLAACRDGLELLEHYGGCDQVDAMRAAIAKAEGRTIIEKAS